MLKHPTCENTMIFLCDNNDSDVFMIIIHHIIVTLRPMMLNSF